MARKKQSYSKKQMADALRMGCLEYSEKYKTSLSSHQRLKLELLQSYDVFKALEVPLNEVFVTPISLKVKECLNNLKDGKDTVFEVKPKKEKTKKTDGKRRGRPIGSKNKKNIKKSNEEIKVEKTQIKEENTHVEVEIQDVEVIERENKDTDIQKVEVVQKPNLIDMLNDYNMSFFAEFLENVTNLDTLVNLGVENYFNKVKINSEKIGGIINDLYHIVEFEQIDSIEKKAEIFDSLKDVLIRRRVNKDEFAFLNENKALLISFCTVFKRAKNFNEKKETRCYTFRQIGQDVGLTGLTKCKDIDSQRVEERMIELERVRIKKEREEKRAKREVVAIDKIEKNWKHLFHEELDTYSRSELYKEASNLYAKKGFLSNFNELKEFIIEMEIMPELLYNKGYFLISR